MNTMLYILGVALVVFVFLGYVRRVRLPELLRAPSALGTCPGAPCTPRLSESPSHPRPARAEARSGGPQRPWYPSGLVNQGTLTEIALIAGRDPLAR
jgi:hypothetical protein